MTHEAAPLLDYALAPLAPWLSDPTTEEVCINRPQEAWIRQHGRFERHDVPELDYQALEGIGHLAGALRNNDITPSNPRLGTELPRGERLQIVLPPCVPTGTASLTLRKPGEGEAAPLSAVKERYRTDGWNSGVMRDDATAVAPEMLAAFDAGDLEAFLRLAVRERLNIMLCGSTGSGKTTMSKTLLTEIPRHERLITIEDALELRVPHENCVRLLYQHNGSGASAGVSAEDLLIDSLRMRPDRVILQELRTSEAAWVYLNEVNTGHPGSITTIHGGTPKQAFRRLWTLAKGSERGRSMADEAVDTLLADAVDVIVPFHNDGTLFSIEACWFKADAARRGETAANLRRGAA
jgi:type IV secretion system protein VirB11